MWAGGVRTIKTAAQNSDNVESDIKKKKKKKKKKDAATWACRGRGQSDPATDHAASELWII